MNEIYLSSDLHFGHQREFLWQPRGFSSIEEHDAKVIENFNKTIAKDDTLILLGDTIMNNLDNGLKCVSALNCENIYFIRGNHDTENKVRHMLELPNVKGELGYAHMLKYGKKNFYLSHYPTRTANFDDEESPWMKVLNVCGHSHIKTFWDPEVTGSFHCELDAHDNLPIHIEDVIYEFKRFSEERFWENAH